VESSLPLLEWLANEYKKFGAALEIITDRSQEGKVVFILGRFFVGA